MHLFTIRDIENLTGIKAHTLRIWEQRYQLMIPDRHNGHHRSYSNEDLKHLLRISTLYHNGYKISRIAALGRDQINQLAIGTLIIRDPYLLYVNQLVEAAIDFDEAGFERIVQSCTQQFSFEKTVFTVLFPFLNKIGLLWMTSNLVPAIEHFASAIIIKKILSETNALKPGGVKRGIKVLLFTPEKERHEMPMLMMQYLLKKNHINTVLLGQHVSLDTLSVYCKAMPVTHIYTHLVTNLQRSTADEYIHALAKGFPSSQIVLSGTVVQSLQRTFLNVRLLRGVEEIMAFSRSLAVY